MLNVSVRPQSAAIAIVSALAGTAGETSSHEILLEQIAAGSKPAMHALFARHRTYVHQYRQHGGTVERTYDWELGIEVALKRTSQGGY